MAADPRPDDTTWDQAEALFRRMRMMSLDERRELIEGLTDPEVRRIVETLVRYDLATETKDAASIALANHDPSILRSGQRLGVWEIDEALDRGGMGQVYKARRADDAFEGKAALKVFSLPFRSFAGSSAEGEEGHRVLLQRFQIERQVLADLSHPNIAELLDGGTTEDGRPYLVMELIDGEPLDRYCGDRQLPIRSRLLLLLAICSAVSHAHHRLIVHRDLKPSNILVTEDGPMLLDFGIAKILDASSAADQVTSFGAAPMTISYASPEQIRGEAIATTSDVYSLGVVLYQLLSGALPYDFDGLSSYEIGRQICETPPRPPSEAHAEGGPLGVPERRLPRDLDHIVAKALAKRPEQRYQSVEQFATDIGRFLDGLPVAARRKTTVYAVGRFVQRNKLATALTSLVLGFLVVMAFQLFSIAAERSRAEAINDFMVETLTTPDPVRGAGYSATVASVLATAEERIDVEFTDRQDIAASLRLLLGAVYSNLGLLDRAEPLLYRALAERRDLHGERHIGVADVLNELGVLMEYKGDHDRSLEHYVEALEILRDRLGEEHPTTLVTEDNLSGTLASLGDLDEAERIARRVLRARSRQGDPQDIGMSQHNLAFVLLAQARFDEALALLHQAQANKERLFGENHPKGATTLSLMAQVHERQGDWATAERLYRQSLEQTMATMGPDHPRVASIVNNLALIFAHRGEFETAREMLEKSLKMNISALGEHHPRVAETLSNLSAVDDQLAASDSSRARLTRAIGILRHAYGPRHPKVAIALNQLSIQHFYSGDLTSAATNQEEALAMQRHFLGPSHPDVATTEMNLGAILDASNRPAEAEEYFRSALRTYRQALGDSHPLVGRCLDFVASALLEQNRLEEAERFQGQALAVFRELFPEGHVDVAMALGNLARIHRRAGRLDQAETRARESLRHLEGLSGIDSLSIPITRGLLGRVLCDGGKATEGLEASTRSLESLRAELGEDHWRTLVVQSIRGHCLWTTGDVLAGEQQILRAWQKLEDQVGADHRATRRALERWQACCGSDAIDIPPTLAPREVLLSAAPAPDETAGARRMVTQRTVAHESGLQEQ